MFPVVKWGLTDEEVDQDHWYHISRIFKTDEPVHESFLRYLKGKLPNFGSLNIQRLVSFLLLMMEQDPRKRMPTTRASVLGGKSRMKGILLVSIEICIRYLSVESMLLYVDVYACGVSSQRYFRLKNNTKVQ